jgi:hypothetical protein
MMVALSAHVKEYLSDIIVLVPTCADRLYGCDSKLPLDIRMHLLTIQMR